MGNDDLDLCIICAVNELVNERERIDLVCDECWLAEQNEGAEQDFDELLYSALDIDEEY